MTDAPRKIWAAPCAHTGWQFAGCTNQQFAGGIPYHHDDLVRELREALAHAAVPLEGLTLAAHYSESNLGLCKGTWDEINNAVSRIRVALAQIK